MPRSKRIFKKRKAISNRWPDKSNKKQKTSEVNVFEPTIEIEVQSTPVPGTSGENNSNSTPSSSKSKLGQYSYQYDSFKSSECYDILDLGVLFQTMKSIAVCRECKSDVSFCVGKRVGLKITVFINCISCESQAEYTNSNKVSVHDSTKLSTINLQLIYGMRCVGLGQDATKTFCALMNFPPPPTKWLKYTKILEQAVEDVAKTSMMEALEEAVVANNDSRDLTVALDGSWQRRGYSSLNGIVSASSFDTGKIIDIDVMSKHCICPRKLKNEHIESCKANYYGSSGGMEVHGARNIFGRSKQNNVRFAYYLGDGDSKGFAEVVASKPYGDELEVQKLECVGHVQKRMGTRLRKLKKSLGKSKLSDNKPIGGKGRLTDAAIISLQTYYGLAIRRNVKKDSDVMRKAVWAEFFHIQSSDAAPNHILCPSDKETWCKYQICQMEGTEYKHEEHFHLPPAVADSIRPIFKDLSHPQLLKKCVHGQTQNLNESYNNSLWKIVPKRIFASLDTLRLGAYEAVGTFNMGQIFRCKVLQTLGIEPNQHCITALKKLDNKRLINSEYKLKKCSKEVRQAKSKATRKLEEELDMADENAYEGGGH